MIFLKHEITIGNLFTGKREWTLSMGGSHYLGKARKIGGLWNKI